MSKGLKYIFILLMLPVIVLFQYGQNAYMHYHMDENGQMVAHSHPYHPVNSEDGTPNPGHCHSSSEMTVLQSFDTQYLTLSSTAYTPGIINIDLFGFQNLDIKNHYHSFHIDHQYLRGPPLC